MNNPTKFVVGLKTAGDFGITASLYVNGNLSSGKCGLTFANTKELFDFIAWLQPVRVMVSPRFPINHPALQNLNQVINSEAVIITPTQSL